MRPFAQLVVVSVVNGWNDILDEDCTYLEIVYLLPRFILCLFYSFVLFL